MLYCMFLMCVSVKPLTVQLGLGYNRLRRGACAALAELLTLPNVEVSAAEVRTHAEQKRKARELKKRQGRMRAAAAKQHLDEDAKTVPEADSINAWGGDEEEQAEGGTLATETEMISRSPIRLTSLDLYHNDGRDEPLRRRITLFKRGRGLGSEGVSLLAHALCVTSVPLVELNLWHVNMGSTGGAAALARGLERTRCPIRALRLAGNSLRDAGCAVICGALTRRCELCNRQQLGLEEPRAATMSAAAKGTATTTGVVPSTPNQFCEGVDDRQKDADGAITTSEERKDAAENAHLGKALPSSAPLLPLPPLPVLPLRVIDLSDNMIGAAGAATCAALLSACFRVVVVAGPNNEGDQDGETTVHVGILAMPIRTLLLHDNPRIGDAGAAALALSVRRFGDPKPGDTGRGRASETLLAQKQRGVKHPLRELDLRRTGMRATGCGELCWALSLVRAGGNRLSCLRLSSNPGIGEAGCLAVADALRDTSAPLATLELRNVGMTVPAVRALADALRTSSAPLASLPVSENPRLKKCGGIRGFLKNWVLFRESQAVSSEEEEEEEDRDEQTVNC